MKKAIGFAMAAGILLLAAGCSRIDEKNQTIETTGSELLVMQDSSENAEPDSTTELPPSDRVTEEETAEKKEYHKYAVSYEEKEAKKTNKTLKDYEEIVSALMSMSGLRETDFQDITSPENNIPTFRYEAGEIACRMTVGWDSFRFYNSKYNRDRDAGEINQEIAAAKAEEFLDAAGLEVDREHCRVKKTNFGVLYFEYRFLYDGVRLMGENALHFTKDEDEIALNGSYVQIFCCEEGLMEVRISNLPKIQETLETYCPETDFISKKEAEDAAWRYMEGFFKSFSMEFSDEEIEEASLIYMPGKGSGTSLLVPAYEVMIHIVSGGKEENYVVLVDACKGFIRSEYLFSRWDVS